MSEWIAETEELVRYGRIKVPYQWWVGDTGTHFFTTLKQDAKILGSYCSTCGMVFLPPRKVCGRCFNPQMDWRELSDEGLLVTFTVPTLKTDIQPIPHPFAYAIVKLDGADTGFNHLIADFTEGEPAPGARVKAVFRDDRQGNILDIMYFKLIS